MMWIGWILGILLLIGLDQITKYWATAYLMDGPLPLIDGVFELHYSQNEGAAWGIFSGARWPLVVFTVVLMAAVAGLLFSRRFRSYKLATVAGCLILAGGAGNLIDRALRGFVVDFLYVKWIDFPIFNVADCCVVIGAALMMIFLVFVYRDDTDAALPNGKPEDGEETADETGNVDGADGTGGGEA